MLQTWIQGVTTVIIHTLPQAKNILKILKMDADQNAQITTLIYANILGNSESATMQTATEYTLRGQCAKDPHKYNSMHYHVRKQTSFITTTVLQTLPLKTNLTKPPVPLTLMTLPAPLLVPTLIPRTQLFPTPSHSLTSSYPHPNSQQPSSPRHNLGRQHTTLQSPSHPPQYYHLKEQPIAKIEPNTDDKFSSLFETCSINSTTQQEQMVHRREGNKFTGT